MNLNTPTLKLNQALCGAHSMAAITSTMRDERVLGGSQLQADKVHTYVVGLIAAQGFCRSARKEHGRRLLAKRTVGSRQTTALSAHTSRMHLMSSA